MRLKRLDMTEQLKAKITAFILSDPEAEERLNLFLGVGQLLFDTADVSRMTGWSETHITRLCRRKMLPHIPGKPNKFMLSHILAALESMQVGGKFGRKLGGRGNGDVRKEGHGPVVSSSGSRKGKEQTATA
jgi:hypothetical protein